LPNAPLQHKLEYLLLLLIQKTFSFLPRTVTLKIGTLIGTLLRLKGVYSKTIFGNMRHTEYWSESEIGKIKDKLYIMMGRYVTDFLRSPKKLPTFRTHNFEALVKAKSKGKGSIFILAHLGNWELLAQIFGKKVADLHVIAKPMKNHIVDTWLAKKRSSTGVTTIYTDQALRKMFEVLKRNGVVAILIDQHGGNHGTMVPFLGKDANTVRTVAGIVHKTGCAVLPTYSIMQIDGSYDIFISEAHPPDVSGMSNDESIATYQKQHNEIISEWIRMYPEHYFGWFHKRFRNIIPYN
jgi:KDO2-lipid IV(A) lauroyltransferase